jgi:NAD(P)-dependent dehydrogenase (short-subunit alcohol dehydrogenase family)
MFVEEERDVSDADILAFAEVSGDHNPLHVNELYAATTNYRHRIAHGAFQVGLASAVLGMRLPGQNVILGNVTARFPSPLRYPARVRVRGEITAWNPSATSGRVHVTVTDLAAMLPTAEIDLTFTMHREKLEVVMRPSPTRSSQARSTLPAVLLTGAAGGIGSDLAMRLSSRYRVLAQVHRKSLREDLRGNENIQEVTVDLTQPGWLEGLSAALEDVDLYGVVHSAWPGAPRGGLLSVEVETLERQIYFGTTILIRLAALLEARAATGGRIVAIGSSAGLRQPSLAMAPYSLGKAALEHTVRLLAPELARKQITINAVCPTFVPVGMHDAIDDPRRLKLEAARVPMGRLCMPEDVVSAVEYLLSPAAGFVSGQSLHVTGGQL